MAKEKYLNAFKTDKENNLYRLSLIRNVNLKMTFNVPIEVQRQIKNYVEDLGYKSESAFCCEAIEEYLSKLQYDSIGTYMNKLLVQAVDCTIAGHTDKVSDMLFKFAVSIEKQTMIMSGAYTEYYMEDIEEMAIENVKKRHGKL